MPTITHPDDGLEMFVNQLGTISLQQYEPALDMLMTVCIRPEHVEAVRQYLADLSAEAQQFAAGEAQQQGQSPRHEVLDDPQNAR